MTSLTCTSTTYQPGDGPTSPIDASGNYCIVPASTHNQAQVSACCRTTEVVSTNGCLVCNIGSGSGYDFSSQGTLVKGFQQCLDRAASNTTSNAGFTDCEIAKSATHSGDASKTNIATLGVFLMLGLQYLLM